MIEVRNIAKKFGGVTALDGVSLTLAPGTVTAVIGENGAGKSTLMKILSGVHDSFEGEVLIDGRPVTLGHPRAAEAAGISIIHQELNLVPELDIAANIFLGREPRNRWGFIDRGVMRKRSLELLQRLGLEVDPDRLVTDLKVGEQQLVEIARALHLEASLIIMDEPTSALSARETERLFRIIETLRGEGRTIVYISHRFDELFAIADRYVVLRDGRSVSAGMMAEVDADALIRDMSGRLPVEARTNEWTNRGTPLLNLSGFGLRHLRADKPDILQGINLTLHAGEVVGLYGLMGAGRTELLESIFGLHHLRVCGTVSLMGSTVVMNSPQQAIAKGIAMVPEDRKRHGIFPIDSIRKNFSIAILDRISQLMGWLDTTRESRLSAETMEQMSVRASSDRQSISELSGGNQQKVVLGRWLATEPCILLLDEPTRGIDVGAKAEIHILIRNLAASGVSVLLASSELNEIRSVSDRVCVMCEGRITADLPISEADEQTILRHALPQKQST